MGVWRGLELQIAVAKVEKYASGESGDTVEMIERPHGGLSLVLADGQRSGRAAKLISTIAARKVISLLADGVRDGAAVRAAHDYLRTLRQGQVSAEVSVLSADLISGTMVISRNTRCPALVAYIEGGSAVLNALDQPSDPIGICPRTKPVIAEIAMRSGMCVILYSDGIMIAGSRQGEPFNVPEFAQRLVLEEGLNATKMADALLHRAIELDDGRPADDLSVVVLTIVPNVREDHVRRMSVRFPF